MELQPSGEITEYIELLNIKTLSLVAKAIAPPDPPSPIIIEIQGESNDGPEGWQVIWLIEARKKDPKKWEGISWYLEGCEREHFIKEKLCRWYMNKLQVSGIGYDLDIGKGAIKIYYWNIDDGFQTQLTHWVNTRETVALLKELQKVL